MVIIATESLTTIRYKQNHINSCHSENTYKRANVNFGDTSKHKGIDHTCAMEKILVFDGTINFLSSSSVGSSPWPLLAGAWATNDIQAKLFI